MSRRWDDPTRKPLDGKDESPVATYTVAVVGEHGAARFTLVSGKRYVVGRGEGADLPIDDTLASRRHAIIEVGKVPSITDLGSANGTCVDGTRLEGQTSAEIGANTIVEIGSTVLFLCDAASTGLPLLTTIDRVAESHLNVLLLGESGVGKEVMADRIHQKSARAHRAFVKINCAALVDSLLEAELFGYEKGAFTGATKTKPGLLEEADGGSFFLDEVGELPMVTQAKLLRVLETGESQRVGGLAPTKIDVRFIAATNRDLPALIKNGQFREDLFFRLEGYVVRIPPLRERRAEIMELAETFAEVTCLKMKRDPIRIAASARRELLRHRWPGNVRELRNVIARSIVLCTGGTLEAEALQLSEPPPSVKVTPAPAAKGKKAYDRAEVLAALSAEGGNQKKAASRLGVSVRTLQNRLDHLGIPRPRK